MPVLTDRQRIELALPASLLYILASMPDVFVPVSAELSDRAKADIAALKTDLRTTWLEPFTDLTPVKREALLRRLQRLSKVVVVDWDKHTALDLMLTLCCFLQDLTDREVLILWEGSTMDQAMQRLIPMCEHGFRVPGAEVLAQERASVLLRRLQREGLYV